MLLSKMTALLNCDYHCKVYHYYNDFVVVDLAVSYYALDSYCLDHKYDQNHYYSKLVMPYLNQFHRFFEEYVY